MKKSVKITILIVSFVSVTALSQMYISKRNKVEKTETSTKTKAAVLSQNDLNGTWYWESAIQTNTTELYLVQNGNTVTGTHCSSFFNGSKTDCAEENNNTISLNRITENIYEGSINSAFSDVTIPVRITLNPATETIEFKQLSQPEQEYYLPNNVTMTLAQE